MSALRYLSVCSGIEAATVAWKPLGFKAVAFSEIAPFPCALLKHYYPDVPNLGDMTKIDGALYRGKADILVGGTPCQAFSIAGMRRGLKDERGNLTLKFVELANAIKPSVAIVWENVSGVLTSADNAFGNFLGGLCGSDGALFPAGGGFWPDAGCVFGPERTIAWRVLDAQYFGLAQQRRRVFAVACPRNGLNPAKILFEWEGLRRDSPPRGDKEEETSTYFKNGFGGRREWIASSLAQSVTTIPKNNVYGAGTHLVAYPLVASAITTKMQRNDAETETFCIECGEVAPTVGTGAPFSKTRNSRTETKALIVMASRQRMRVRRITPLEVERLQGFPDNYTNIEFRGTPASDGQRYMALGNSMAVNVMRWIGQRIASAYYEEKSL